MGWTEYKNVLDSWFGYSEARGQDDIIIDIYNSQRVESYKMSHQDPWCHATISAAGYQSGNQGKVPNTAYCPYGINWFKARGLWTGRYAGNYAPAVGDIIYYDWGGDGVSDHVGAIIKVSGNTLTVREGNRNDMVCDRTISKWSNLIMGYGRPDWGSATIATIIIPSPVVVESGSNGDYGIHRKDLIRQGQQHAINFTGVKIGVDGIRGPETKKAAIRCVQHAMNMDYNAGLKEDGIWGKKTDAAFAQHYVCEGETQYMVTAWEILLLLNGYDPNGVEHPGEFGSGCAAATRMFQGDKSLAQDGVAGRKSFLTAIN
ncbi:CHAP domain-containing protein [Clostridium sp. SL.3.18]|nr:CHAP domain-containing protein [Clostridium sp. SL.3.18]